MTARLTRLTPEQESAMAVHAREWIDRALEVRRCDRDRAERGIRAYYRIAGLHEPLRIVWTTSPLAVALAGPIAAGVLARHRAAASGSVDGAVDGAVRVAVSGAVDGAVDGAVRVAVYGSVSTAVSEAVDGAVDGAVSAAVRASVSASVRASVSASVRVAVYEAVRVAVSGAVDGAVDGAVRVAVYEAVSDVVDGAVSAAVDGAVSDVVDDAVRGNWHLFRLGGHMWPSWPVAYGTFFRDRCGLSLAPEALTAAEDATECGWWWPHRDYVIVCDRPTRLERDNQGRLHSADGPAIAWEDGWGVYAWHGTRVPREWIEQRDTLTAETVLHHRDMEQRRAGCEILGWDRILASLPHRVIDADPDEEIGTLIEIDLPDSPGERFVRARCGTGRWIYYGAPPEARTALEACAASYQLTPSEYQPEVRT